MTGVSTVRVFYVTTTEVVSHYIDHGMRIKGVSTGDHEIKIINFANDAFIFLCDVNYLTRLQHILKLYEKASKSKIKLSKILVLRVAESGKIVWFQFFSKISKFYFGNPNLDNNNWYKINDNIQYSIFIFGIE